VKKGQKALIDRGSSLAQPCLADSSCVLDLICVPVAQGALGVIGLGRGSDLSRNGVKFVEILVVLCWLGGVLARALRRRVLRKLLIDVLAVLVFIV
jgi:hypothetical protein